MTRLNRHTVQLLLADWKKHSPDRILNYKSTVVENKRNNDNLTISPQLVLERVVPAPAAQTVYIQSHCLLPFQIQPNGEIPKSDACVCVCGVGVGVSAL